MTVLFNILLIRKEKLIVKLVMIALPLEVKRFMN